MLRRQLRANRDAGGTARARPGESGGSQGGSGQTGRSTRRLRQNRQSEAIRSSIEVAARQAQARRRLIGGRRKGMDVKNLQRSSLVLITATAIVLAMLAISRWLVPPPARPRPRRRRRRVRSRASAARRCRTWRGVWQALNEANWDLEAHWRARLPCHAPRRARREPVPARAGAGARARRPPFPARSAWSWAARFPTSPRCWRRSRENFEAFAGARSGGEVPLPGVPRATYLPYPFQSDAEQHENHDAVRVLERRPHHSPRRGRRSRLRIVDGALGRPWEGDTLVVNGEQPERSDLVRSGRQLSQLGHECDRTLHDDLAVLTSVRGDDRRSDHVYAALDDQDAALQTDRRKRARVRIPLHSVDGRARLRPSTQDAAGPELERRLRPPRRHAGDPDYAQAPKIEE